MSAEHSIGPEAPVLPRLSGPIGPALPISDDRAQAMVNDVLREWDGRTHARYRMLARAAVFTLGFLVSGGGAYAVWQYYLPVSQDDPAPAEHRPAPAPSPALVPAEDEPPDEEPPPEAVPADEATEDVPARQPRRARTPRVAPAVDEEPVDEEPVDEEPVDEEPVDEEPVDEEREERTGGELLAEANALRAQRRWADAERVYATLLRTHRGTSDAYAAMIAAASLRLEKLRNPRGALTLYRQALRSRPRGHLAEEARLGIAQCQRALGNRSGEIQAVEELLARHPRTPHRAAAEARLAALRADHP
jgi:tetratricopeptide (TPR) repeat protein